METAAGTLRDLRVAEVDKLAVTYARHSFDYLEVIILFLEGDDGRIRDVGRPRQVHA